jgi:hypothetical protein
MQFYSHHKCGWHMPLHSLSGFTSGEKHTQTAMFLLEDDSVAETGFGNQEWEHIGTELGCM